VTDSLKELFNVQIESSRFVSLVREFNELDDLAVSFADGRSPDGQVAI